MTDAQLLEIGDQGQSVPKLEVPVKLKAISGVGYA
jgi:hypothetical protein